VVKRRNLRRRRASLWLGYVQDAAVDAIRSDGARLGASAVVGLIEVFLEATAEQQAVWRRASAQPGDRSGFVGPPPSCR
jgi:hypothetical protein